MNAEVEESMKANVKETKASRKKRESEETKPTEKPTEKSTETQTAKEKPTKRAKAGKKPTNDSIEKSTEAVTNQKSAKTPKKDFNARLEECKAFREKSGHCKIPIKYKEDKSLGIWVQETRRNFKLMNNGEKPRKALTDEQIEKLDDIGFHWGFTPDPFKSAETDRSWDANFAKLQEYQETNGNFDIPMESPTLKLATWARVQRNQYNLKQTKRKCFITSDRIKKLNGVGFDWKGERKTDA